MKTSCFTATLLCFGSVLVPLLPLWSAPVPTNAPGRLDLSFDAGQGVHGTDGSVRSIALQPDGKAVIGGRFQNVGDVARSGIARLETNGSVDMTFDPSGVLGYFQPSLIYLLPDDSEAVLAIALQTNGQVIVGGHFTTQQEPPQDHLIRLNDDGSLDPSFAPLIESDDIGSVRAVAVQSDGKILLGGRFETVNGAPRQSLARLNSDGTLDLTFVPLLSSNAVVHTLLVLADGSIVIGGQFESVEGMAQTNLARLLADGRVDPSFISGFAAAGPVLALAAPGDGRLLVGGWFYTYAGHFLPGLVRVDPDGSPDLGFLGISISGRYFPLLVSAIGVDPAGQIVVGGNFEFVAGSYQRNLTRLLVDGRVDRSFSYPGGLGGGETVTALALQQDGQWLLGGGFHFMGTLPQSGLGLPQSGLARIRSDGNVDPGYTPAKGFDAAIDMVALQPDGRIVVAGPFQRHGRSPRPGLARLQPDGTLDATFEPEAAVRANQLLLLPNGTMLVAGSLCGSPGLALNQLGLLGSNGRCVRSFGVNVTQESGDYGGQILTFLLQNDGRILIGGEFHTVNGVARTNVARLLPDGQVDPSFTASGRYPVRSLAVVADGKVLLGHSLSPAPKPAPNLMVRLNADGTRDPSFIGQVRKFDSYPDLTMIDPQPDGRILIAGAFDQVNGQRLQRFARLNADGSTDASFSRDVRIGALFGRWVRQLDGRILVPAFFQIDANNAEDDSLPGAFSGTLVRLMADGRWDESFVADPSDLEVRAVALASDGKVFIGGAFSSVGGVARRGLARLWGSDPQPGPPIIQTEPLASSAPWGGDAGFRVIATGRPNPLSYQWNFNGIPLIGATNAALRLTNLAPAQAGEYIVVVSNSFGAVTSMVATLSVNPGPVLSIQPAGAFLTKGDTATVTAKVYGQPPVSLQWSFRGEPLDGATSATLTLPDATPPQSGEYTLAATSLQGNSVATWYLSVHTQPTLNILGQGPDGSVAVKVSASPGEILEMESSTDLQEWWSIGYLQILPEGIAELDYYPPGAEARFFRANYPLPSFLLSR